MSLDPPPLPLPPRKRKPSFFFRPSWVAAVSWLIATVAYVALVGVGGRRPGNAGAFGVTFLAIGLPVGVFIWLVAGWARRAFKRTTPEANLFFCVGIFAFMATGIIGQFRSHHAAHAAPTQRAAADAKPTTAPAPATQPINTFRAPALAARKEFLAADKYLREKSAAQTAVALADEGKPWRWIDTLVEPRSPEFKRAYQAWRAAEIQAGTDPAVSEKEYAAIARLHAIRMAIAKYRAKNDRPPTLRHIAALPANPLTGHKALALAGMATAAHGWSYDEQTGRIRIVLPPQETSGGLHRDEIERVIPKR